MPCETEFHSDARLDDGRRFSDTKLRDEVALHSGGGKIKTNRRLEFLEHFYRVDGLCAFGGSETLSFRTPHRGVCPLSYKLKGFPELGSIIRKYPIPAI